MAFEHDTPDLYFDKPVEQWTLRELHDVLGTARVADLLDISQGNVRVLRYRGFTSVDRMIVLQAAVEADRDNLRTRLTINLTGYNARRPRPTQETHA
jgi:hypothetical protein